MKELYDAVVIGAGPAGTIASMLLKKAGKKVLLIDKARFPRDKICGDAQGRKLASVLNELGIYDEYRKLPGVEIYGLRLSSPKGVQLDIDIVGRLENPGYIVRRKDLDNFLFRKARALGVRIMEEVALNDIIFEGSRVKCLKCTDLKSKKELEIRARLYIGADGADSLFARKLGLKNPPEHFIVALRAYYRNVSGLSDKIELHLLKNLVPGYLWIFPLTNNEANVGLGMVVKARNKKGVNLAEELRNAITENPLFKERFRNAEPIDGIKAWNLPLASHRRKCFGENHLLVGDAAGLINPLSGEGVGTASLSARHAVRAALKALDSNEINEEVLSEYEKNLWNEIGKEIQTDYRIQKLGQRFPFLVNRLIDKASKDEEFRKKFESLIPHTHGKEKIGKWSFIASLFF